ncbi:MAG: 16S rRNA (cytidine(1402)-2'-O)-methyltransferase [Puniceicoccales bacterium]|jgi:16S rRNA (cytidine1402-2'-O)-methyltransferase|nr:16S rRNA (cytidine(1402)-2'-O)-methyltransferase [Puniceicoccales bacterium]
MEDGERRLPAGLYLVATPIGNLEDITLRAISVLRMADGVACEDTRTGGNLLRHLGIRRPLLSYHEHNERQRAIQLADAVAAGQAIALVSDAGTPAISDPGFRAVRECRRRGLPVIPIPGPCALAAAISAAGLPSDAFLFLGFLPPRSAARRGILRRHGDFPHTLVIYESCHRVQKFLGEIAEELGPGRTVALARELTKLHETWSVGTAAAVAEILRAGVARGEFTVLIAPADFEL